MSQLWENPELREKLGKAGQRALQMRWSEPVVLKKYYELIHRIAEEKRPELARQMIAEGLALESS